MNNNRYWTLYRAAFKLIPLSDYEVDSIHALYKTEGREAIFSKAKMKKIIPGVAKLLVKLDIDKDYWQPIYDSFLERNKRVISYLDSFYEVLEKSGITKIAVVENFGALLYANTDLAVFGSGDSDNFGDRSDKDSIDKALINAGYRIDDIKSGSLLVSTSIRREDTDKDNFYISINWDVTNRVNLPCFTSRSDFMNWDACNYYKGTHIRLPSPEALMYICLLHISVHGFCKSPDIRLYYDVANVASRPIDWSKIIKWAEYDDNCLRIAIATALANRMLGVSIPKEVMSLGNAYRRERLLRQVSRSGGSVLRDFPNRFTSLLIDICSNDNGINSGLKYVLFPPKEWIKKKYGEGFGGRVKHIVNLFLR